MRILATCDLHYNIPRSKAPTEAVIRDILDAGGDALLLLGDLAGMDLAVLERVFEMLAGFRGARLYTPGNHEMWTPVGDDTMRRYESTLPALCARYGVHYLDSGPFMADGVAIVGRIGWYDYSFRPAELGLPLRFYEQKIAPGSASIRPEFRSLVEPADDVPAESRDIVCRWMDREHVRLPVGDPEFAQRQTSALRADLRAVTAARQVVVGLHHLPFAELVPKSPSRALQFATAFLGSELLGEALLEFPNVRRVLCGHSHRHAECSRGGLTATAIGSTYTSKRFEQFDL